MTSPQRNTAKPRQRRFIKRKRWTRKEEDFLQKVKQENPDTKWNTLVELYNEEFSEPKQQRTSESLQTKYKSMRRQKKAQQSKRPGRPDDLAEQDDGEVSNPSRRSKTIIPTLDPPPTAIWPINASNYTAPDQIFYSTPYVSEKLLSYYSGI